MFLVRASINHPALRQERNVSLLTERRNFEASWAINISLLDGARYAEASCYEAG